MNKGNRKGQGRLERTWTKGGSTDGARVKQKIPGPERRLSGHRVAAGGIGPERILDRLLEAHLSTVRPRLLESCVP